MIEARPQNPFQRWVDLGGQTSKAVTGLRDLCREIGVEAALHGESTSGCQPVTVSAAYVASIARLPQ